MRHLINPFWTAILFVVLASSVAIESSAAEVRTGISTRETYVGQPVILQIQISNAAKFDPPTLPEVDGLAIKPLGAPSHSTQTTIINGNMTSRTSVTYSYEVTPQQPGSFRIPPVTVQADGQEQQTQPFEFVASRSATGDLLFADIAGREKQIYVGQSLDLTLKIWVRPYHDKEHSITLSDGDMWQLISERTAWGAFADRIQQMTDNNQRPPGTEVLRKDRDGAEHSYYLYEINATIYPKRPGKIDANDVQIVVEYPTAIGRLRDPFSGFFDEMPGGRGGMFGGDSFSPFGRQLTVESVRPIVAEAKVEPIEVLDIPTAGRPADYRGAVGKYRIVTEASPENVKAGDPINLLIGIAGTGPMELVQAPPLADLADLSADFKVPNEPLAGFVQKDRKVFSTTIRPRKEGVTRIPAIPFSYFDPEAGKFFTVQSQPISVHVAPADTLALDAVVGRSIAAANKAKDAQATFTTTGAPSLAIYTGNELLTNEMPAMPISGALWMLLAIPPIVVLWIVFAKSRHVIFAIANMVGSSIKRCQRQIEQAKQPADVAFALRTLIANRLGLSGALPETSAVVGALRSAGYRNLAVCCERILQQCEGQASIRFNGDLSLGEIKSEALQLIDELQKQRRSSQNKPAASPIKQSSLRSSTTAVVAAMTLAGALHVGGSDAQAATNPVSSQVTSSNVSLTEEQRQTLLTEANGRYDLALKSVAKDSAEAKQAFAEAAEKYQLLVDSGVRNSRLYFNLANACLQCGESGHAIANYRRALQLDPTNQEARTNLSFAENQLAPSTTTPAANHDTKSLGVAANALLNRYIGPRAVLATAIFAWFTLWVAIGLRQFSPVRFPWKTVAAISLLWVVTSAASYSLSCQAVASGTAIVVSSDATLRNGDGAHFPSVAGVQLREGQSVKWLKRRSHWVQIQTEQGLSGWLPNKAIDIL